jgi:hypothetical protein
LSAKENFGRGAAAAILSGVKKAQMASAMGMATIRINPIVGMLLAFPNTIWPWVKSGRRRIPTEPSTASPVVQP